MQPVSLILTGKFQAPNPEWMHMTRLLNDYELIVMTDGSLYIGGDHTEYVVQAGEYHLMPPLTRQYGVKPADCRFYWLHFSPAADAPSADQAKPMQPDPTGQMILPQQGMLKNIDKVVVLMKQLQDAVRTGGEKKLHDYMATVILLEIYHQMAGPEVNAAQNNTHQQLYNDIIDYVQWNCRANIRVSQIASHFGYNEKYLSHLFTTVSGMPLKQYILQQKMAAARFILADTNDSISEIAAQLGFTDSHHFMKTFKKMVGLTPTAFRNAYAKRLLYYQ